MDFFLRFTRFELESGLSNTARRVVKVEGSEVLHTAQLVDAFSNVQMCCNPHTETIMEPWPRVLTGSW